ncbi:MAG: hypothetical protein AABO58_17425 [Acidobacteriota bacterium]
MISCQTFRANLQPGTHDADLLEHLRRCDSCLDFAVQVDPDTFFRALGGDELVPPGGVDAFVGDVMAQVRSRETETATEPRRTFTNMRRLAIAATVAAAVSTGLVVSNHRSAQAPVGVPMAVLKRPLVTKPIVETYESNNATIIEVPSEAKDDVQVVMIFDESLPVDL